MFSAKKLNLWWWMGWNMSRCG